MNYFNDNEKRLYAWYFRVYAHIAKIANMRIDTQDTDGSYMNTKVFIDGMDYGDNKCEGCWGYGHVTHKDMLRIFYEWNDTGRSVASLKLDIFNSIIVYR